MNLFLIMSIPLWFLFLNSFYKNEGIRKRDFFITLGKGSIVFIGSLLVTWLLTGKMDLGRLTPLGLFFYNLFYYNGFTNLVWLTFFFMIQFIWPPSQDKLRTRELLLFLVPLFLGDAIYRGIIQESWYGLFELYLLPLSNMSLLVILAIIISKEEKEELLGRILYYLFSLFVVLVANLIPLFMSYNFILPSILLDLLIFVLSLFLFFREMNR